MLGTARCLSKSGVRLNIMSSQSNAEIYLLEHGRESGVTNLTTDVRVPSSASGS